MKKGYMNDNIVYKSETDYNILPKNVDVWPGELPFKEGDKFPTPEIKERAMISCTNRLIYQNDVDEIYANIINVYPEIDPIYGWQIREIITNLPYFKNAVNYWVGLIAGEAPIIDGDDNIDDSINEVIENSNFRSIVQNEVRSRFMDVISAYRVDINIYNKPTIIPIEAKNLICYVSKEFIDSIEVNVIFNIYTGDDGKKYVEFIEYHYDGLIRKKTFLYKDGSLGRHVKELDEESRAFSGRFKMSPIVVFKHNAIGNEVYGTDQFRYWSASILGAMRELQNIFRLAERTREIIRKVPDSAVKKDPVTGQSMFFNKGTIGYPDGAEKSPDIEYIVPDIKMEEAIRAFEKAVKSVSIDTNLGPVFFDLEKLGTNLSAKSIEAALYPTKLEAKRITSEMTEPLKELVVKLCAMANIDLTNRSKFNIMWFDGFPKDVGDYTDAIQKRLGNTPSISLEDAIIKLDRVPSRIATQKANEIRKMSNLINNLTFDKNRELENIRNERELNIVNTHEIKPNAGEKVESNVHRDKVDDTIWESQMIFPPRDIQFNRSREVGKAWIKRKLRKRHW